MLGMLLDALPYHSTTSSLLRADRQEFPMGSRPFLPKRCVGASGTGRTGGFVALTAAGGEAEAVLSPAAHCTHDLAEWEAEYVAHRDGAER